MKRFSASRWNRILVWTGAALAWGTALVAAKVEPVRAQDSGTDSTTTTQAPNQAIMPQPPPSGLTILR
ncbi:MAG: hypothetical protein WBZ40_04970, partial [Acidimicrobiia bacterium]